MADKPQRHAHVCSVSSDCDGRYDREYIDQNMKGLDSYDLLREIFVTIAPTYGEQTVTWTFNDEHERLELSYATEEGGCAYEVYICTNKCDPSKGKFRDHTAEKAGY